MSKTLCKSFTPKEVVPVKYVCKRCGALARKEKHLCKPKKI